MSRFSRFLHLERKRGDVATREMERTERAARFDAVQVSAPRAPGTGSAEGHLVRFEQVKEAELEVDHERELDQPFIRCAQCQGDNARFARQCQHCQADLDTAAQRRFNEEEWARLRVLREEERAEHAAFTRGQEQLAQEQARLQRDLFERMALESRRATLARLDGSDPWTQPRAVRWTTRRALWSATVLAALFAGSAVAGRSGMVVAGALLAAGYVGWTLVRHLRR